MSIELRSVPPAAASSCAFCFSFFLRQTTAFRFVALTYWLDTAQFASAVGPQKRAQLTRAATELRSMVRVKLADDQDIDQARAAVSELADFFSELDAHSDGSSPAAADQLLQPGARRHATATPQ